MSIKLPLLSFLPEYPIALQNGLSGFKEIYPYRALVSGFPAGIALLNDSGTRDYISIEYLHAIGFGPAKENVIFLTGESNLPSRRLLEPHNSSILEKLADTYSTLECYSLRESDGALAIALGMPERFVSLQSTLAQELDDKVRFRNLLTSLRLEAFLVDGGGAYGQGPVTALCRRLLNSYEKVVLQTHPNLAGGIGFHKISTLKQLHAVFADPRNSTQEMLLTGFEESYFSPSVNWTITESGPKFLGTTMQLMHHTFTHAGNFLPSGLTERQIEALYSATLPIATYLHNAGYRWDFGVDAILPKQYNVDRWGSNFKLVELNARRVAPFFLRAAIKFSGMEQSCVMLNIYPSKAVPSEKIHNLLRSHGYLYGVQNGFCIPFMTNGGMLKNPKFAVFCFGETPQTAAHHAVLIQRLFGDRSNVNFHLD